MIRFPWRFIAIGIAAAWAFDFFFWKKPLGISLLIWSSALLLCGLILARSEGVRVAKRSYFLMVAVLLSALVVFIRLEPFSQGFNFVLVFFLLFLLAATFGDGFWTHFRLFDYLATGMKTFAAALARPFDLFARKNETEQENNLSWKTASRKFLSVLLGLVLAAPVLLILGALLASADPIFSDWMKDWLHIFDIDRLGEYLFRFCYILLFAYLLIGLLLHAVLPKGERGKPDPLRPLFKGFLGSTETTVVLLSVNLLFAVFLVVQFRYFFGGSVNIAESGYTFSEYARRGFSELVAVALISLLLYMVLGAVARNGTGSSGKIFTILSTLLMGQVIVMLVSAFQRLLLYEDAYGFTRLRIYSHVFMVWLGILLAAVIVFEIIRQRGRFALALLLMTVGFGLTLGLLNVDGVVVRQNVRRAATQELDGEYLKMLSRDAVPAIMQGFHESQDETVRDILGAELACRAAILTDDEETPWPGFSWSRYSASRLLLKSSAELEAYPVSYRRGEWMVMGGGDELQSCFSAPRFFED